VTIGGLEIDDSLIDAAAAQLLASGGPAKLIGPDGFLPGLVKAVLERGLQAELAEHLGYDKGDPAGAGTGNSRDGTTAKTVRTEHVRRRRSHSRDQDASISDCGSTSTTTMHAPTTTVT